MSVYATLGALELELIAWWDGLTTRYAAEYAEQALIARKSLLQYTGARPDEVRIQARLHAAWCDPAAELRALKERLDAREPLALTLASGEYRGTYVVTELEVTTTLTDGDGRVISLELTATLKEYVGDPAQPSPPGVILNGMRLPLETAMISDDVLIAEAPADSPGGLAAFVSDAVSAIGRGVSLAADLTSLAALGESNPAAALLALPDLVESVAAFGDAIPAEQAAQLMAIANLARDAGELYESFSEAREQWTFAAEALRRGGLSGLSAALASARAGMAPLEDSREALGRLAALAASRTPVGEA